MTITPEVAQELLSRNYDNNRKVRPTYVNALANSMRDGEFVGMNGQTIVIGASDGKLYDGQHRLMAIVQSGVPVTMIVAYVDDAENAFKTIDAGTPRRAADFIDAPNKGSVAAAAKALLCIEQGTAPLATTVQSGRIDAKSSPSRVAVINFFNDNRERVLDVARIAIGLRSAIGCGAEMAYSTFVGLVRFCGRDEMLSSFCDDARKTVPDSRTVTALKGALIRRHLATSSRGLSKSWQLGMLLDAYEQYIAGDGSTTLNKGATRIKKWDVLLEDARNASRNGGDVA